MTLPTEVRSYVLGLADVRRQASVHSAALRLEAQAADAAAAIGLIAYADELEQVAKVLGNYTQRLDRDLGDLNFIAAERKDWETTEAALERLLLEFEALMNKAHLTELTEEEEARYQALSSGLHKPIG